MSILSNWFSKKDIEVADLEEIKVEPKIVIPEKTRRELYDSAVKEVVSRRVENLILRDLIRIAVGAELYDDTMAAIRKYGEGPLSSSEEVCVRKEFPNVKLASVRGAGIKYAIEMPHSSLNGMARALTKLYMESEDAE